MAWRTPKYSETSPASALVSDNINVTAAYTYTDARITKDAATSLVKGHQMTGVPRNQASVWAKYRFLDGDTPAWWA